jgi:hypothetical protein
VKIVIDSRKMQAWRGRIDLRRSRIRPAAAHALNYVGEKTVGQVARQIAAQTGIPEEQVRRRIIVRPASAGQLRFEIDATAVAADLATRPMPAEARRAGVGGRDDSFFKQAELVNIVDMGDSKVCPVCEAAAADGPYTIEEARGMIPLHPNCRCVVQPMRARRTAPLEDRRGTAPARQQRSAIGPPEVMGDLLGRMRSELRQAMRAGRG